MDEIKTDDYYIAYLDILGYKNIIAKDENDEFLKNLKHVFTQLETSIEFTNIFSKNSKFKLRIFSDNVVICYKITDLASSDMDALGSLVSFIGALQGFLLMYGYTSRGAITSGQIYWDNLFLFGKGLVDVYNLENKQAKYPRVIIDNELTKLYEKLQKISNPDKYPELLKQEYYYIDFYKYIKPNTRDFPQIKIEEKLEEYKSCTDDDIRTKLEWLIKYHNSCCDKEKYNHLTIKRIDI